MILKKRTVSKKLIYLRSLSARGALPDTMKMEYWSLERGFDGEQTFDRLLENTSSNRFALQDLYLEHNNSLFQIDFALITPANIHLFEVKNFEGNYYIEGERWYSETGIEIKNPVLQLKRTETLFRQFIQPLKLNIPIQSQIIFINPEFTLFQASRDLPIVLPTQYNKFLKSLECPGKLYHPNKKLTDYLLSNQSEEPTFNRVPNVTFETIKKGVFCECGSKMGTVDCRRTFICPSCGYVENYSDAIIRNVNQFKVIFPENKITVKKMMEWCDVPKSESAIRRILKKHFTFVNLNKYSYYS